MKCKTGQTNHRERKYRRLSRAYFILFAIAASLLVMQTMDKAAVVQQAQRNAVVFEAAIYAGSYALRSEQKRAGRFEALLPNKKGDLKNNVGYSDNLRKKLAECQATVDMITDGSAWTGHAGLELAP